MMFQFWQKADKYILVLGKHIYTVTNANKRRFKTSKMCKADNEVA